MYCGHCGTKIREGAKFCQNCGKTTPGNNGDVSTVPASNPAEVKSEAVVKCGNCDYIGPGEPARSTWAKVLAWICVFFAPLITIIYFTATHKYRCPNCKSTFLGVRNKEGVFTGQKRGAKMIFIWVLLGIIIVSILATLLLLQLGVARVKARDAKRISDVNQLRVAVELYFDDNGGHYPTVLTITNLGKYFTSKTLPADPLTNQPYGYLSGPPDKPTAFVVYAELEQKSATLADDSDIKDGDFDGSQEACTDVPNDCIYDLGYIPH